MIKTTIKAGTIDITPATMGIPMAGFGPGHIAQKIAETLEINIIWLGDETGHILASMDCLFCGTEIRRTIADTANIPINNVTLAASHTHYAPALEQSKPSLGAYDASYLAKICSAVAALIADMKTYISQPFSIAQKSVQTQAGIHRRLRWPYPHFGGRSQPWIMPGIENVPNPDVRISNLLRIAAVYEIDSNNQPPLAIIWSLACHPTRYYCNDTISSDFIGVVRNRIRQHYGKNLPVIFLQGFSGDIIPRPDPLPVRYTVSSLLFGPRAQIFSKNRWHTWSNAIADFAIQSIPQPNDAQIVDNVRVAFGEMPLSDMLDFSSANQDWQNRTTSATQIALGSLRLTCISAEVVGAYEKQLTEGNWPIGCVNHVFGYWPTDQQVQEGGYESHGFFKPFGVPGRYATSPEKTFMNLLSKLSEH